MRAHAIPFLYTFGINVSFSLWVCYNIRAYNSSTVISSAKIVSSCLYLEISTDKGKNGALKSGFQRLRWAQRKKRTSAITLCSTREFSYNNTMSYFWMILLRVCICSIRFWIWVLEWTFWCFLEKFDFFWF